MPPLRVLIFATVVTVIYASAHWLIARRITRRWALPLSGQHRLMWATAALGFGVPVAVFTGRAFPELFARGVGAWTTFLVLGWTSSLLLIFGAAWLIEWPWDRRRMRGHGVDSVDPQRRVFLRRALDVSVASGTTAAAIYGFVEAVRDPEVVEVEVPIAGLPKAFDGFAIAQLTDVHVGPTIGADFVRRCVAITNELNADIVALTGDLVDGHVRDIGQDLAAFAELKSTYGTFFVTGNHEYYWNGPAWVEHLRSLGATPLINEHRVLERAGAKLVLAGVTDHSAGKRVAQHGSDPAAAKEGAPAGVPAVLLAHQPRSIYKAAEAGYDLQISGHTHAGQYFPMNLLVHLAQPYVRGLHRHGETQIYVNPGTGYWGPPNRSAIRSEIAMLRLRRA